MKGRGAGGIPRIQDARGPRCWGEGVMVRCEIPLAALTQPSSAMDKDKDAQSRAPANPVDTFVMTFLLA